ncbi:MAG: PKD domain-containing protein [Cyclobacteriaceae bacterium]
MKNQRSMYSNFLFKPVLMALGLIMLFVTSCGEDEPTIVDPVVLNFGGASASVAESGSAVTAKISLSIPAPTDISYSLKVSGTAVAGTDYTMSPAAADGSVAVSIKAGDSEASIVITPKDNDEVDSDRTVILTMDAAVDGIELGSVKAYTLTITNDDQAPDAPVAGFSGDPLAIEEGGTVTFTNSSTGAESYAWTFEGGEPATSTEANPTVTYATAGDYDVTLVATGPGGENTKTETDYVKVSAKAPVAAFSGDPLTLDAGGTVTFTDASTDATSWAWTFEGGEPATSTEQNPTVTYATAGTYDVTLVATGPGGESTEAKTDYVTVNEVVASGPRTIDVKSDAWVRFDDDTFSKVDAGLLHVSNNADDGRWQREALLQFEIPADIVLADIAKAELVLTVSDASNIDGEMSVRHWSHDAWSDDPAASDIPTTSVVKTEGTYTDTGAKATTTKAPANGDKVTIDITATTAAETDKVLSLNLHYPAATDGSNSFRIHSKENAADGISGPQLIITMK